MREKFNDHWFFHKDGLDSINQLPWEIKDWQRIDIPHDWMIYQVKDLYENSIGYYKKIFDYTNNYHLYCYLTNLLIMYQYYLHYYHLMLNSRYFLQYLK